MASYTVYVPSTLGGTRRRADRTVFIREGFSRAAFIFGPLYLLYHKLWLAALGWIVVAGSIAGLGYSLALSSTEQLVLVLLLSLLTGLEATVLRQAGLRRAGYEFASVVACPTLEQAERAFFNGEGLREAPVRGAVTGSRLGGIATGQPPEVIGSFAQSGGV